MDYLGSVCKLLLCGFPSCLNYLYIGELIEDAVTTKHDEIVIILNLEALNVWCCNHHLWIALVLGTFGLNVTKSSGNR